MKAPICVRPLTAAEREAVEAGVRSSDAVTLRRCQILRASAAGVPVPQIARVLGCNEQPVRNAIHAFNHDRVAALTTGASRPHTTQATFDAATAERRRVLLHRSPRALGHATSLWTLDLAAAEAVTQGLTARRGTGDTIRATLARLGVRWLRAKTWITSPDPAYEREKGRATA